MSQQDSRGNRSRNRNRPKRQRPSGSNANNKNRRPKSLTPSRIQQKYDNLLEQHIVARRKYFESHGRVQGKQLEKIEYNFDKTLTALRDFENNLKDWQLEVLNNKINGYPEDRQYSKTHELTPKGDAVAFDGDFDDPHLLKSQQEAKLAYAEDTEESVGTIDDYKTYKGISE